VPLSVLSLFRYFGFLNSFQDVLLLHIFVYMLKFMGVGSGDPPPQHKLFILHSTVGASVCMSVCLLRYLHVILTRGSAMAEALRDALVSRNSATTVQNIPFEN